MDLFEHYAENETYASRPLADKMRPKTLDEFIGQEHVTGNNSLIRNAIKQDRIFSMILWGPPGCGKTTLAGIIANETQSYFIRISAVMSGVKDIRAVIDEAKSQQALHRKRTILFVDEIHRFNKAQQDAFLHHVESGLITLIGATTENPSFEVIPALISRCRVITLNAISSENIIVLLKRALSDTQRGLGTMNMTLSDDAATYLSEIADGDVRAALNGLEITASLLVSEHKPSETDKPLDITLEAVEKSLQKKALLYDKSGEEHYNIISAFHKSLRGSDPDAALYWLERMLSSGEDPFYIARRMVRFASEDIGNADPQALDTTLSAMEAFRFLGHPEGELALAQAALYLATAPKSNSIYAAHNKVKEEIGTSGSLPVPLHIRNAPTRLMKDLGYGKEYKYSHDFKDAFVPQEYLPEKIRGKVFYNPTDRGYEKIIKQRLDRWRELKHQPSKKT